MRIALIALLVLLAGCADSEGPTTGQPGSVQSSAGADQAKPDQPGSEFLTPLPKETVESLPECSEIWTVGETLPDDYAGCRIAGGGVDQGARYACTDGKGVLIGYNDQFFARLGGPVQEYGDDEAAFSQELFQACKPKQ